VKKLNVKFDRAAVADMIVKNRPLAIHMAVKYARRYPRVELDDLVQECSVALTRSAQLYKHRADGPPFNCYALMCITQACWHYVNRYGWPAKELSLDDVVGNDDDAPLTVADQFDHQQAEREEAERIPEENYLERLDELQDLIETLPSLTKAERRVLRLHFTKGHDLKEIRRRIYPKAAAQKLLDSSLTKLKAHFGIEHKPWTPGFVKYTEGRHTHWHVKYHSPRPDCPFCRSENKNEERDQ
jgi:RNA polymerase sigma factor (sigma-70 family)